MEDNIKIEVKEEILVNVDGSGLASLACSCGQCNGLSDPKTKGNFLISVKNKI
jgi:hypothetical protein